MTERKQALVENNLPLVTVVIKRNGFYALDPAMEWDDLFQIGTIGLIKAAESFSNDGRGFAGYACRCIFNEIAMQLRKWQARSRHDALISPRLEDPIQHEEALTFGGMIEDPKQKTDAFLEGTPVADFVRDLRSRNPVLCRALLREIDQSTAGAELGVTQSYVSRLLAREKQRLLETLSA